MNLLGRHSYSASGMPLRAALVTAALWLLAPGLASSQDTSGPVPCKDGTTAPHGGRGACSGHGGIDRAAMQSAAAAASPSGTASEPTNGGKTASTAPSQSTTNPVLCKDGTTAAHGGRGACSGHGGIDKSAGASTGSPTAGAGSGGAAPAPPATNSQATPQQPTRMAQAQGQNTTAPRAQPAPGGGPGVVWVNTQSKIYHCPSDRWYGKTQQGEYMTEAQAKSQGFRPDHNKPCE
jgi:hypothetical protein